MYFKIDEFIIHRKDREESAEHDSPILAIEQPAKESPRKKKANTTVVADCHDVASEIKTLLHAVPVESKELEEVRTSLIECLGTLKRIATTDSNLIVMPEESRVKYTPLKKKRKRKPKNDYDEEVKKALISAMLESDSDEDNSL